MTKLYFNLHGQQGPLPAIRPSQEFMSKSYPNTASRLEIGAQGPVFRYRNDRWKEYALHIGEVNMPRWMGIADSAYRAIPHDRLS